MQKGVRRELHMVKRDIQEATPAVVNGRVTCTGLYEEE